MTVQGPTRGAEELDQNDSSWSASPMTATFIRLLVVVVPILSAFLAVVFLGDWLWRPAGVVGLLLWIVQATIIGTIVSRLVDKGTRRLLPLAALFEMSLAFPDQAPDRFSVALRAGTIRNLQSRTDQVAADGLGSTAQEAATNAVALTAALSRHDRKTRGHTERVRAYADIIAQELKLSDHHRNQLAWGVLLHDVGKLFVPPEILNKSEALTEEEWLILKDHPRAGRQLLEPLSGWLGGWLGAAGDHHECWDGSGYPNGLAGEEISLAGRITAVADAFDVITSKRSYKDPMSNEAARNELVRCSGTQFDPGVVRAFLNSSLKPGWAIGPIAGLIDLPLSGVGASVGATPATILGGATIAVSSLVVATPDPGPPPEVLALAADVEEVEVGQPTTTTTIALATTTSLTTTSTTAPAPIDSAEAPTITTAAPTSSSTTATTVASTAAPTTQPTTAASTTAAVTAAPTTAAPTTAPPTTQPTTTTTAAPITTTTTIATTTTTTTAPAPPAGGQQNVNHVGSRPASLAKGALESDSFVTTFDEPGPVNFGWPFVVYMPPTGQSVTFETEDLNRVTVPAGTNVCSRFVHHDPVTTNKTLTATIVTPGDIYGVLGSSTLLTLSHGLAGPGAANDYDGFGKTDQVELVDSRTLTIVALEKGSSRDQMRIIYSC